MYSILLELREMWILLPGRLLPPEPPSDARERVWVSASGFQRSSGCGHLTCRVTEGQTCVTARRQ